MSVQLFPIEKQAKGAFNNGAILENKPIGFPGEGGQLKPYSNLFYWAHAWSNEGSTIPLHPHKGFEILSFVLKGELEHYDTAIKKWIPLKKGDAQIIKSGSGISHSERINEGCEIFQIWFDPGLSQAMLKPPSYEDFTSDDFPVTRENGIYTKWYAGRNGPIKLDAMDVVIKEITVESGACILDLDPHKIYGFYLLDGEINFNDQEAELRTFIQIKNLKEVRLNSFKTSTLFVIEVLKELPYMTYAQRMKF